MNERNEGGFGFIVGCGFMFFVFGSCISTAWLGYSMGKGYSDPEIATENQKLKRENDLLYRQLAIESRDKKQTCFGFFCNQNQED